MCVCIFPFTAHGTVCTFVVHEYKITRWTYVTMVQKSQIILCKMFTTPGMYNYGANNILSRFVVRLISSWCLQGAMVVAVFVVVCFLLYGISLLVILMGLPVRFLGKIIPPKVVD